jgi:hypothetical protein
MRLLLFSVLLCLHLGLGDVTLVSAQNGDGTPELVTDVVTGRVVQLYAEDGQGSIDVTVRAITRPMIDLRPTFRGLHWIGVQFQITNMGELTVYFDARKTVVVDREGFTYAAGSPNDVDSEAMPGLSGNSSVTGGSSFRGWMFYELPDGAVPTWVVQAGQRITVLAAPVQAKAGTGIPVTTYDIAANPEAILTVDRVTYDGPADPLLLEENQVPVSVDFTAELITGNSLGWQATAFGLVDSAGQVHTAVAPKYRDISEGAVPATELFGNYALEPGKPVHGTATYAIDRGVGLSAIVWNRDSGSVDAPPRLYFLALAGGADSDFDAAGPVPPLDALGGEPCAVGTFDSQLSDACTPVSNSTIVAGTADQPPIEASVSTISLLPGDADPDDRLVAALFIVSNTGSARADLSRSRRVLVGVGGFKYQSVTSQLPDELLAQYPPLPATVEPMDSTRGWEIYRVSSITQLETIAWSTDATIATVALFPSNATSLSVKPVLNGMHQTGMTLEFKSAQSISSHPAFSSAIDRQLLSATVKISNEGAAPVHVFAGSMEVVNTQGQLVMAAPPDGMRPEVTTYQQSLDVIVPPGQSVEVVIVFASVTVQQISSLYFAPTGRLFLLPISHLASNAWIAA